MVLVPPSPRWRQTAGGHGLLEAVPRVYQVTPDIPDRGRATKQQQVRPQIWPTASKRVSSPPVGTLPSASDVTDEPNHNSKPQSSGQQRLRSTRNPTRSYSRCAGLPTVTASVHSVAPMALSRLP